MQTGGCDNDGRLTAATGIMRGARLVPNYPIGTRRLQLRPLTRADIGDLVALSLA